MLRCVKLWSQTIMNWQDDSLSVSCPANSHDKGLIGRTLSYGFQVTMMGHIVHETLFIEHMVIK